MDNVTPLMPNMQENIITVSVFGYWTELQLPMMPSDKSLYFVFSGLIVGNVSCKLLRTIYIGDNACARRKFSVENIQQLRDLLSEGESLFFAFGEVSGGDAVLLRDALVEKFKPSIQEPYSESYRGTAPFTVRLDGKVPGIYREENSFQAPVSTSGVRS